jgi:hypothetical protein
MSSTETYRILTPITVRRFGADENVRVDFSPDSVARWCIGICLLEKNLVGAIILESSQMLRVQFQRDLAVPRNKRVYGRRSNDKSFDLRVGRDEFEYWQDFVLRCCRDEVADVDHIDLEVGPDAARGGISEFTLTFGFPSARAPMSGAQLKRMLKEAD